MPDFPTSLDTLTNPGASDTLEAVPHHTQHGTANDILEALEAKLGIGSSTPVKGTQLRASATGTSTWSGHQEIVLRASGGDDAAAFRTAVAAASEGTTFLLPDPYYIFSTASDGACVEITKKGIRFKGWGREKQNEGGPSYTSGNTAIKCTAAGSPAMFRWSPTSLNAADDESEVYGGGMSDLSLGCNGTAGYGIVIYGGVSELDFSNLFIAGPTVACVLGGQGNDNDIAAAGGHMSDYNIKWRGCIFRAYTTVDCVYLDGMLNPFGTAGGSGGHSYGWYFYDCNFVWTAGTGLYLKSSDDVFLYGCGFATSDPTTGNSIVLDGSTNEAWADTLIVNGCYGNGMGSILVKGTGLNRPGRGAVIHGLSMTDAYVRPVYQPGGRLFFTDSVGRHNFRFDVSMASEENDDFVGGEDLAGTFVDGAVGKLRWNWLHASQLVSRLSSVADHHGIVRISTDALLGVCGLSLGSAAAGVMLPTETFDSSFFFRLPATDNDTMVRVGFGRQQNSDPPTYGIYLEKLYADTEWYAVCRDAGVQTRTAVTNSVDANEWIYLEIYLRAEGSIGFTTRRNNDAQHYFSNVTISTNVPSLALNPMFQVKSQSGAAKLLDIDAYQLYVHGMERLRRD